MWIFYAIAALVVILDQLTKWLVVQYMELAESIEIIPNLLYITSHRNRGAAWGILQGQMWFFYIVTVVVVAALVFYLHRHAKGKVLLGTSIGFMLGGAIGNFIDRLFRKEVVDFVNTYIGSYNFPIFNVADAALTVGVVLLFIEMLREEWQAKKEKKNGTTA
ncbi:signal peptidase II [Mangrovibacillus cuniculi]|uniref:Lipoprotein signal peptidase n=1 Tax=Mangrovibacillus cuniculi TaxID=2593652 RepID=A0A7S8CA92_9BACI|nr:signal peptidase II [Mangrovibacillus cuniculi]QPC46275.1 lipoprotein signal peptidase [Mangrovibacillus cuniculi]